MLHTPLNDIHVQGLQQQEVVEEVEGASGLLRCWHHHLEQPAIPRELAYPSAAIVSSQN